MRIRRASNKKGDSPLFHTAPHLLAALALFAAASACRSTPTPNPFPGSPIEGATLSQFAIELDRERVGVLLEADFRGALAERRFLVQNAFGQQIGFVDALGRAYRYRVADGEPEHCATGTMEENLRAILRLPRTPRVIAIPR